MTLSASHPDTATDSSGVTAETVLASGSSGCFKNLEVDGTSAVWCLSESDQFVAGHSVGIVVGLWIGLLALLLRPPDGATAWCYCDRHFNRHSS